MIISYGVPPFYESTKDIDKTYARKVCLKCGEPSILKANDIQSIISSTENNIGNNKQLVKKR